MLGSVFSYLSCGFKTGLKNFKNFSNIIKYWIYLLSSIFSKIFILFYPPILVSKYKIGDKDNHNIQLLESLSMTNTMEKYWNTLVTLCLKLFLNLMCIVLILLVFCPLVILGLSSLSMPLILLTPAILVVVIFCIFSYIFLYPSSLLVLNDNLPTQAIKNSIKIMKSNGKFKVFLLTLFSIIIKLLTVAILSAIPLVLFSMNGLDTVTSIIIFLCVLLFIFVFPYISYSLLIAKVSLTKDLISTKLKNSVDYTDEESDLADILSSND